MPALARTGARLGVSPRLVGTGHRTGGSVSFPSERSSRSRHRPRGPFLKFLAGSDSVPSSRFVLLGDHPILWQDSVFLARMAFGDPEFRTDLERMLIYHRWSRGKYLDLFDRLPWRVLTRKRGATFESIRNVHLHVLAVYASWLVGYFSQKQLKKTLEALDESRWKQVRSVERMRELNRRLDDAVQVVAHQLGPADFDKKRPLRRRNGKEWPVTPREVLWHMIEEDFLHHGEILCMLWQDDIEPPYTGVWWFQYDHDPGRHQDSWHADPSTPRPSAGGYVSTTKRRVPSEGPRRRASRS